VIHSDVHEGKVTGLNLSHKMAQQFCAIKLNQTFNVQRSTLNVESKQRNGTDAGGGRLRGAMLLDYDQRDSA
jgi:hypothetical protein